MRLQCVFHTSKHTASGAQAIRGKLSHLTLLSRAKSPESKDSGPHFRTGYNRCPASGHTVPDGVDNGYRKSPITTVLLSSRLYCWFRTFTESAVALKPCSRPGIRYSSILFLSRVADFTASRELHPTLKNFTFIYMKYYIALLHGNQGVFRFFIKYLVLLL